MQDRLIAVYILSNKKCGTLYIGSTTDLHRRMTEHKNGIYEGFAKKHGLKNLIYAEPCPNLESALILERRYKKWERAWKIAMIEKSNPHWLDLCDQFW
jgi:putative endonuclease